MLGVEGLYILVRRNLSGLGWKKDMDGRFVMVKESLFF